MRVYHNARIYSYIEGKFSPARAMAVEDGFIVWTGDDPENFRAFLMEDPAEDDGSFSSEVPAEDDRSFSSEDPAEDDRSFLSEGPAEDGRLARANTVVRYETKSENVEYIDLKGNCVFPGFVDSHMHLLGYALEKSYLDLSGTRSLQELLDLCSQKINGVDVAAGGPAIKSDLAAGKPAVGPDYAAGEQAPITILRGVGFDQNSWDDPVLPTRWDLDKVSDQVPIIVQRVCHHVTVCNTPALEMAGLLSTCPDGILREFEQDVLEESLPPLSKEKCKELILAGARDVAAKGITEIGSTDLSVIPQDPMGETIISAYQELDEEELLPIRVYEQFECKDTDSLISFLDKGYGPGQSSSSTAGKQGPQSAWLPAGKFTIGPLKLFADGAIGPRTAAVGSPYKDMENDRGILNYDDEELFDLCRTAHDRGLQIAIHAIGDRAIEQVLGVFERIEREEPAASGSSDLPSAVNGRRHGLVHCQITTTEQLERIKKLGLITYIQPVFIRADMNIADDILDHNILETSYNWRAMIDMGIHASGGSDAPVEPFDILPNMYYAVTMTDPATEKKWLADHALTKEEALKAFTYEGAYASFSEAKRGSLLPGTQADFVVLDQDILKEPAGTLLSTKVLMTVVAGEEV